MSYFGLYPYDALRARGCRTGMLSRSLPDGKDEKDYGDREH